ncbi:hypothetical protein PARC_b0265 [Pseudoalteromonas arctica A 37-1-2]|uniref:Uncharacterized protein n=1 Tax=Pseudoalteromonas arctica A 37-1-2 TaxID=1117313 RepID=A0A290S8U8_9GAMM|nr:hypothetical protein PARC_b0265 [Pseudoalteromonas arctica A 37-1-2]
MLQKALCYFAPKRRLIMLLDKIKTAVYLNSCLCKLALFM